MNLAVWNIRGLNHPIKQAEIRKLIHTSPLNLTAILETKVRSHNLDKTCKAINSSFCYFGNHTSDLAARILLLWNPSVINIHVLSSTYQSIFCHVTHVALSINFFVTFVYASNDRSTRKLLWQELHANKSLLSPSSPWLIIGDFNVVKSEHEKKGGRGIDKQAVHEFCDCLEDIEVTDLRFSGCLYTWTNKQCSEDRIFSKLDRALVNEDWLSTFPNSEAFFPTSIISDHSSTLVNIRPSALKGRKPFKFFNYWTKNKEFMKTVEEEWSKPVMGTPMFVLCTKLKSLKASLKALNSKHYGSISTKVMEAKAKLEKIQREIQLDPKESLLDEEIIAVEEYTHLALAEEAFYKQKARDNSIKVGDQNTSFFHRKVKAHCSKNKVLSIQDTQGVRHENYEDVKALFIDYYKRLLGTPINYPADAKQVVMEVMQVSLPMDLLTSLAQEVNEEEIKSTLFSLPSHKAPGPDGYTAHFFKKAWHIVGEDFTKAIKSFFRTSKLPKVVNSTSIALVPKCPNPSRVTDYRPISCCSTVYKCISKLIANRLKKILPLIISPSQAAFVKGRSISDQILLMQELVRNYQRKGMSPRCALKIDLMKAFDSVSWDLIIDILSALHLPHRFVDWIKACMTTPHFSLALNGALEGYFPGARGLRQGDPLSPYLFLIAMEFFSKLLNKMIMENEFEYHPKCSKPLINHICFADDLFILCTPSEGSFHTIHKALKEFHKFSGLQPNGSKSKAYFSGVNQQDIIHLCAILGFQAGELPVKYLGVPLISTKLKYGDCSELIEKITKRAKSWTSKCLSYAGRLVLIKSILLSIQVYWSTHFLLPKNVCNAIEQVLRRFLWSGAELKKRGSKVAWDDVCKPKNEGGLGLPKVSEWNKASMLRHIWAICNKNTSLWVEWSYSYILKGRCFWEMKTPSDCSWTWRKLLKLREEASRLSKYIVSKGESISLWYANWHPLGPLIPKFGLRIAYDAGLSKAAKVSSIIQNGQWKWPRKLRKINLDPPSYSPYQNILDKFVWIASKSGVYGTSATWESIRQRSPKVTWHKLIWFPLHIPRHSFILWLAIKERLNTKDRLIFMGYQH